MLSISAAVSLNSVWVQREEAADRVVLCRQQQHREVELAVAFNQDRDTATLLSQTLIHSSVIKSGHTLTNGGW